MKKIVPFIKHIPGSHTADTFALVLKNGLLEWKVSDRICAVVTDNGANMVKTTSYSLRKQLSVYVWT